jgi:hypothetical protein
MTIAWESRSREGGIVANRYCSNNRTSTETGR